MNVQIQENVTEKRSQDVVLMRSDLDELTERFGPKKSDALILAEVYSQLGFRFAKRASRVSTCGTFLEFAHEIDPVTYEISEHGRLYNANFCRDPLCPMCQWRKSLKQISQISRVLSHPMIKDRFKPLFITLTIPNVPYADLSKGLDKCLHSFKKLMKRRKYQKLIKGFYRTFEVTVNQRTETFHPHLHVLVLVPLSYGKSKDMYISHDELLEDWRKACNDPTITQVDIRVVRDKKKNEDQDTMMSAALEVGKYVAKVPKSCYQRDIVVGLINGLQDRRTYSYGGIMKTVYQALNLEDIEVADLIHIDDEVPAPVMQMIVTYKWDLSGYKFEDCRIERNIANDEVC